MKFKFLSVAALFGLLTTLSSCEDLFEDANAPDGSVPSVSLNSPSNNKVYKAASPIKFSTTLFDKDQITELSVIVTTKSSEEIFNYISTPNQKSVQVDTVFAPQGLPSGEYTMKMKATDGRTNVSERNVSFSVK